MMTFKQLEAVFWIVKAGGFSQAAVRLHTSQAAVSKRVQELESSFDIQIFDRSGRSARLTERGEAFSSSPVSCWRNAMPQSRN